MLQRMGFSVKYFVGLYQQNKSSECKLMLRQASNSCKRVLETAKLAYSTKRKRVYHFPETWLSGLLVSVLNKGKSTIYPLFKSAIPLLYLIKQNCAKNFFKSSNLDDSGISLPVFCSRMNLRLHSVPVTPKKFKKVITNLPSHKNKMRFNRDKPCKLINN